MKKVLFALAALFIVSTQVSADRPVDANQLPAKAQEFIKQHFPTLQVSFAKQDNDLFDRSYTVVLTNGDKVEFTAKGEWTEVDCEHNQVPAAIIPTGINNYLNKHHKGHTVTEIKKERRHYEVKLNNKLEMEFSPEGKLLRYD